MSKPRIAIAGFGQRGKTFVELAQGENDIELVGICDNNASRLESFARKHKCTAPLYTDLEKMLDETRPEGVVIAVPDFKHAEVAVAAMKRVKEISANFDFLDARVRGTQSAALLICFGGIFLGFIPLFLWGLSL
ncbi:MAG: Gfo/Idh/MocA family oxidoreductase [Lentisphaeria bacterium]|nr:Gfo/Idh/MocA family oxidoreductase [Lentisphaeria bacterium]